MREKNLQTREGVYRISWNLIFSQNLKRPLFTVFCWQDPMNCASVGTKNLGNTGVWTRNTKNTIVVVKITTYAHFCCKNHKVGTFVSKITTYAFFCRENHKIRALLSRKSQHTRTLVERKKIGIHKTLTPPVPLLWSPIFFTWPKCANVAIVETKVPTL